MTSSSVLITLTQAKDALVIESDEFDSQLLLRCEEASGIVVDYIKRPAHGWTDMTVPSVVRAAILIVLKNLWENPDASPISQGVIDLLVRQRDPALA